MIRFLDLQKQYHSIKGEIDAAISDVISGAAFVGGTFVSTFEREFAQWTQAPYCIGVGNGTGNAAGSFEGAVQDHILGTYLHGPGLARNPELADLLLSWAVGSTLLPWAQADIDALRAERLATVRGRR